MPRCRTHFLIIPTYKFTYRSDGLRDAKNNIAHNDSERDNEAPVIKCTRVSARSRAAGARGGLSLAPLNRVICTATLSDVNEMNFRRNNVACIIQCPPRKFGRTTNSPFCFSLSFCAHSRLLLKSPYFVGARNLIVLAEFSLKETRW